MLAAAGHGGTRWPHYHTAFPPPPPALRVLQEAEGSRPAVGRERAGTEHTSTCWLGTEPEPSARTRGVSPRIPPRPEML